MHLDAWKMGVTILKASLIQPALPSSGRAGGIQQPVGIALAIYMANADVRVETRFDKAAL